MSVEKLPLLRALESTSSEQVRMRVGSDHVTVTGTRDEHEPDVRLAASVTGLGVDLRFAMTTLYPAVSTAIGADLLLDLRGPDRPATVRSADHGDLTTLAMPTEPTHS